MGDAGVRIPGWSDTARYQRLGGLEVDQSRSRVADEIASFDSAAAWALEAGNTGSWRAGHFPENGVAELFAEAPDLVMAASFSPPRRAEPLPSGYRFTGRGPVAGTIHDSPWVMMTGLVFDGEQPRMTSFGPIVVAPALRTSEMQIIDIVARHTGAPTGMTSLPSACSCPTHGVSLSLESTGSRGTLRSTL